MWFKIKVGQDVVIKNKVKHIISVYLSDKDNFAEAGYAAIKAVDANGEVEDVMLMKTLKPLGNTKYDERNKVFIVKIAEDYELDDGSIKTIKYPIPFYANNNEELQKIIKDYIGQGLQEMRVTTVSETAWEIVE